MIPQAGPSYTPPPASEEQRFNDVRNATNLRSVTRNDPSVLEIIDTSVYSVIYYYDEAAGAWEKQKQEGPLFVVKRSKSPEYALFMLNRQAVKGVTMPLVPQEMKLTVVDASTLQVARRGEKLRKGIWFSEGSEAVERFRKTILRICGEPSKKPATDTSTGASPSNNFASPSPQPLPSASDGLSRLFAGLLSSPATSSPPTPSPGHSTAPLVNNSSPAPTSSSTPVPLPNYPPSHTASPALAPPSQPPALASPVPPPVAQHPSLPISDGPHPPGQTVDDLLSSILGIPPQPPQAAHARSPQFLPAPTHDQQSTPPPNPVTANRVRDESYARIAGGAPEGVASPPSQPTLPQYGEQLSASSPHAQYNGSNGPVPNGSSLRYERSSAPSPARTGANPAGPIPGPWVQNCYDPPPGQLAIGDALLDGLGQARLNGQVGQVTQVNEVGKRMFVQDLLQLIHTDQGFVEHVWRGYLARTGQMGPPQR